MWGREFAAGGRRVGALWREGGEDLVLFLHGFACAKESFASLFAAEDLAGFSLLAPDLAGHGESPVPPGFGGGMEEQAALVRDLLDDFPHQRLHVVAHSMGGAVGLLLARERPEPLASFVCVEGNLIDADCDMMSRRVALTELDRFVRVNWPHMLRMAAANPDPGIAAWAGWARAADPALLHAAARSLVHWSDGGTLLETYRGLAVPALYVYGERSANLEVLNLLADQATARIPACGHFPMVERPAAFRSLVGEFLASI